ncbi:uncharacterized protein LOC127081086 [Lathyrus oleraceus]|uniref:uncharacterized protein LOC127081086 n=1 Tax=Pisum sativum TaxID=3888 RepID=UPI0021D049D3|nr:uncharacterized protein LOC127081086 [Pisum sativum]
MEEYAHILDLPISNRVPFSGVEGILESQVIAEAIHLRKSYIDVNLTVKGGIRGLTSKFLLEKAFSFANANNIVAFEAIISLLVYGLVMFPNIDNFVDVNVMRIFLIKNLVPTLLDDTYFYIHHRTSKGGGTIVCCSPLLYKWFSLHLPQSPVFHENKDCLRWSQRLVSLNNDDITWYSSVYDNFEIIDSCGSSIMFHFLVHKEESTIFWLWKGKNELGLKNSVALEPYTSWVKKRAKEFKMKYTYERPMSLIMVKSPTIEGIDELQEALDRMKQERGDWEGKFHISHLEKVELQKQLKEKDNLIELLKQHVVKRSRGQENLISSNS